MLFCYLYILWYNITTDAAAAAALPYDHIFDSHVSKLWTYSFFHHIGLIETLTFADINICHSGLNIMTERTHIETVWHYKGVHLHRRDQIYYVQIEHYQRIFFVHTKKYIRLCIVCTYIVDAVGSSRILIGKQKLGRTFNSDKLGGIDFTKISKLTMCSA